jgi:hypothetical protein
MILALDIGNTETTIGLCEGLAVRARWRVTTDGTRTPDEVFLLLLALLDAAGVDRATVHGSVIGSAHRGLPAPHRRSANRRRRPIETADHARRRRATHRRRRSHHQHARCEPAAQARLYRRRSRHRDDLRLHHRRRRLLRRRHRAGRADVGRVAIPKNGEVVGDGTPPAEERDRPSHRRVHPLRRRPRLGGADRRTRAAYQSGLAAPECAARDRHRRACECVQAALQRAR